MVTFEKVSIVFEGVLISITSLTVILLIIYIIYRKVKDFKKNKKHRKSIPENKEFITNAAKQGLDIKELNFKIVNIELENRKKTKELAWFTFIQISTRFTYNNDDDSEKNIIPHEVLRSFYELFKEVRNKLVTIIPEDKNLSLVILFYLNNILRPFLRQWDNRINEINENGQRIPKKIENETKTEFIKSIIELKKKTDEKRIINELLYYCGFSITENQIKKTITSHK